MAAPLGNKWNDSLLVTVYKLTAKGYGKRRVSEELGIPLTTLRFWFENKPAFKEAVQQGRADYAASQATKKEEAESPPEPFFEYCYRLLPRDVIPIWDELVELAKDAKTPRERVRAVLATQPDRIQQHLWVHAMVVCNFNKAEASRLIGCPVDCFKAWMADPRFVKLMDTLVELKKDWVEGKLMHLVDKGDTQAVIFTSRTLNRDRGYDPKITVEHTGKVLHGHVDMDSLPIDVETKRKLLAAYRQQQSQSVPALAGPGGRSEADDDRDDSGEGDDDE